MIVKKLAPGLIIGVFIGSIFANHLKGSTLQAMIALFLFFISFKIWREKPPKVLFNVISKKLLGLIGLLVGGMSAFFGIGGGSLVVPFLLSCKEKMSSAVACSAAWFTDCFCWCTYVFLARLFLRKFTNFFDRIYLLAGNYCYCFNEYPFC